MLQLLPVESLSHYAIAVLTLHASKILPSLDKTIKIGVMYISMTDKDRLDPFTNCTRQIQVMVSICFPVQSNPCKRFLKQKVEVESQDHVTPYMTPLTVALYEEFIVPFGFPSDTFEQLSKF